MNILAFETSSGLESCAVARDGELLSVRVSGEPFSRTRSLLVHAREALEEARVPLEDVGCFASGTGPGSYTGIRIGCAAVKGLCLPRATPAAGVSSLYAAVRGVAAAEGTLLLPVADAQKGSVYFSAYLMQGGVPVRVCGDSLAPAERLLARYAPFEGAVLTGPAAGMYAALAESMGFEVREMFPDASQVALAVGLGECEARVTGGGELTAVYARDFIPFSEGR